MNYEWRKLELQLNHHIKVLLWKGICLTNHSLAWQRKGNFTCKSQNDIYRTANTCWYMSMWSAAMTDLHERLWASTDYRLLISYYRLIPTNYPNEATRIVWFIYTVWYFLGSMQIVHINGQPTYSWSCCFGKIGDFLLRQDIISSICLGNCRVPGRITKAEEIISDCYI